ncbi:MAG: hypothetical protein O3A45_01310 [Proteobacteria bacterium]|jgi:hypothetical protein|nr:hypothetical protein [Pseudomonadota bacterium]MDA1237486.1 hypothetical protein [Pseudomonadota bacterium]
MREDLNYISNWVETFTAQEGTWPVLMCSVNEMKALISKACIGRGLPSGHAYEMASLASGLMADQVMMGFFIGALYDPYKKPVIHSENKTLIIDQARFVISGPMAVDALISGAERVILNNMPWKMLITPLLINAENTYKCFLSFEIVDNYSLVLSHSVKRVLPILGDPKPVPLPVIEALEELAKNTYVPSSDISRRLGAGAGLIDTD